MINSYNYNIKNMVFVFDFFNLKNYLKKSKIDYIMKLELQQQVWYRKKERKIFE